MVLFYPYYQSRIDDFINADAITSIDAMALSTSNDSIHTKKKKKKNQIKSNDAIYLR